MNWLLLMPPWLRDTLLLLVASLLALFSGWGYGKYKYHEGYKDAQAVQVILETKVDASSLAATLPIITHLEAAQVKYQATTNTIIKEIPRYVTKEDDSHCVVPNGFVSLWNSANQMSVPASASTVPSGASEVVLSDIETQHTVEAGICHANETTLQSVADWLRAQQQVYDKTR